jgi:hypothetical protein
MLPTKYIYGLLQDDLKNYQGYLYPMEASEIEERELKKKIEILKREQDLKDRKMTIAKKRITEIKEMRTKKCSNSLISQIGLDRFKSRYGCDDHGEFGGGGGSTQREKDKLAQEK